MQHGWAPGLLPDCWVPIICTGQFSLLNLLYIFVTYLKKKKKKCIVQEIQHVFKIKEFISILKIE
jgi:hypothetical protein